MHLPEHEPLDPSRQADLDRRRLRRALWLAGGFVALLWWIKMAEVLLGSSWAGLSIQPREATGLLGVLTAPLLHGSLAHLLSNTLPLLVLGTLAFAVYPRAATRAVPAVWLLGGLGVWLFARDSFHLGASGVAHGLMLFLFVLGVLRRDRPSVATALVAFFLYGGMLLTVLPREPHVSWESHLAGAVVGALAAWRWRALDPAPPRKRYSWELEDELAELERQREADTLEPPRPEQVPVLWHRPAPDPAGTGVVIPFRRPPGPNDHDGPPPGESRPPRTLH